MGNPVQGERDSGLKPNTIPLWFRTAFRSEGERRSGGKANILLLSTGMAFGLERNAFHRRVDRRRALDNHPALKLHS